MYSVAITLSFSFKFLNVLRAKEILKKKYRATQLSTAIGRPKQKLTVLFASKRQVNKLNKKPFLSPQQQTTDLI